MSTKDNILKKAYIFFFVLVAFGVLVSAKIVKIQVVDKDKIEKKVSVKTSEYRVVPAKRGDIYANDGSLLATSLNYYEVGFDLASSAFAKDSFKVNLEALCDSLSALIGDKSASQYKEEFLLGRQTKKRWYRISKELSYPKFQRIKKFPFIRLGRFKSGFVYRKYIKREKPFGVLAGRTVGRSMPDGRGTATGLEGSYDYYLKGKSGEQYQRRIPGGIWVPVSNGNSVDPVDGADVYSTLDVNIQEITTNALRDRLVYHKASHGCAVVMEVKTGKIRAMANLVVDSLGNASEQINYAVGGAVEPGSTFKLATLMALLEDQKVKLTDEVNLKHGIMKFHDRKMKDSHYYMKNRTVTVQEGFEISSNVMFGKLADEHYSKKPQDFINRLYRFGLHENVGVDINGEGSPKIKDPSSKKEWSGTTLPWMAHGYSVELTPLHVLTLYNAVANDGKMVRPYLVEKIEDKGSVEKKIGTSVINHAICSKETNESLKKCLEGVVERGTAKIPFRGTPYKVAGKTGTAKTNYWKSNTEGYRAKYSASFAGYFPADNPVYSCIIVINDPKEHGYYGSNVAAPVFRTISDKLYTTDYSLRSKLGLETQSVVTNSKVGNGADIYNVNKAFGFESNNETPMWSKANITNGKAKLSVVKVTEGKVPNVRGMLLQDALYLLEKEGLKVRIEGRGTVKSQSIQAGQKVVVGKTIKLKLG